MNSKYSEFNDQVVDKFYDLITNTDHQWVKEWASLGYNQQNSKEVGYNGLNQINLFTVAVNQNQSDPRWLTFNEIKKNNFKLKKGAKGQVIGFFTKTATQLKKDDNGKPILDENGKKQYENVLLDAPVFKSYYVFSATQVEGIEPFTLKQESEDYKQEKYKNLDETIKAFCENNGIGFRNISSESAFFSKSHDNKNNNVVVPLKEQFSNPDCYYATVFHEIVHSTKLIISRTNKETDHEYGNTFGSKNYAKEELVAEIGSMLLCKKFGLSDFANETNDDIKNNSLAYLKGWFNSKKLEKNDLSIAIKDAIKSVHVISSYHKNFEIENKKTYNLNAVPISDNETNYNVVDKDGKSLFSKNANRSPKSLKELKNALKSFLVRNNANLKSNEIIDRLNKAIHTSQSNNLNI